MLTKRIAVAAFVSLTIGAPVHRGLAQTAARTARLGDDTGFLVRSGDVLRIRVWPDSALGGEFPVEETGLVYLPVLGEIRAAGMALEDLRRELRRGYGEAIKSPVVTVTPLFRVSVLGAVERPGLYRVDPTQSLFDVISVAGGFRPDAKQTELRVIREGRVLEINAKRALETGEALLALALRSGDRVVVPQRKSIFTAQNILLFVQTAFFMATTIELLRR